MQQKQKCEQMWPMRNTKIANFLGVSENNIRSHQRNHSKELIEGIHFTRELLDVPNAPCAMTVWTKEGAIKLAHYCKRSAKARLFLEGEGINKLHINYIEGEIIDIIIDSVSGFITCYRQYSVAGYRVDLYLKEAKLVIECDEMGHEYKNNIYETHRQTVIKSKLGCEFIRFNPDEKGFRLGKVINQIFQKIITNTNA